MQIELDIIEVVYSAERMKDTERAKQYFEKAKVRTREAAPLDPGTTGYIAGRLSHKLQ